MTKPTDTKQEEDRLKAENPAEREVFVRKLCKLTGASSEDGADLIVNQLATLQIWFRGKPEEKRILAALDMISEFKPANWTEALLSVQIIGVHEAAIHFLQRATLESQTMDGANANVLRATKLLRLFAEQVELMAKLKGKTSQQKVTVEHVHVHQGGQAIVGAVSAGKSQEGEGANERIRTNTP